MNNSALILMSIVWCIVIFYTVYFMYKVVRSGKKKDTIKE